LGDDERIDSLEVWWPGGDRQMLWDLEADRMLIVGEGEGLLTGTEKGRDR
jgi:hypothetical protein